MLQQAVQHTPAQGREERAHPPAAAVGSLRQLRLHRGFQENFILPQQPRQPGRCRGGFGIDSPQHGHNLVTDQVAGVVVGQVAAVCNERLAQHPEVALNLGARARQQRAHDVPAHRRDAGQPFAAGAARQMEEHGFEVVIGGMGGCRETAAVFAGGLRKKPVTDLPCGLLNSQPGFRRVARHRNAAHCQRHAQPRAQRPHKRFVPVGLRAAQAVVQMESGYTIAQLPQCQQQGGRIRAARECRADARPFRQKGFPRDERRRLLRHGVRHIEWIRSGLEKVVYCPTHCRVVVPVEP